MPATSLGKEKALEALAERRKKNASENWATETLKGYAGSPMYFGCLTCNGCISVPESYTSRPKFCSECTALKELGWLET